MTQRFETLDKLIDFAFKEYADLPAFTCMGHTLSFREVDDMSARFADFLLNNLGLKRGDSIAIQMPNILQFPVVLYGAVRAGIVVVNVNPLYTPREIEYQLKDSGAKALVVLSNVAASAASIIANTDVKMVVTTDLADFHPTIKRCLINFVVKKVKKLVPAFQFPNSKSLRDVLSQAKPSYEKPEFSADDVVVLQYTGGTTGVAKGAMLTHGNLTSNVWQMIEHMPNLFVSGKEVWVACLPFYHIYAFNMHGLVALSTGGHNLLIPNPRDLPAMVKALEGKGMTIFIGINTLMNALSRFEAFKALDFSTLKLTTAGGMALSEDVARVWQQVTGSKISEGYGLTETSPVVSGNPIENIQIGTIGLPLPETEVKVIDEAGTRLASGEVGELCVRGPQVMRGYWRKPEETAQVLSEDGWLCTGDMAIIKEDGYIKIVDRKKDMILVSGFNVYPNEIEDIVCTHPDIIEAAAVGVPDDESGEAVKLFLVKDKASLTEDEVYAFCKERLTGYKRPKFIEFREALPKSNVGKILRKDLREKPTTDAA